MLCVKSPICLYMWEHGGLMLGAYPASLAPEPAGVSCLS